MPGSADGVFRILTCARTVAHKRLERFAHVLCRLPAGSRVEWTHIGDGERLAALRRTAQNLPQGVTAQFLGALPHEAVLAFYRSHPVDLFVSVSAKEGLPVSVMEALSFGVPAVVTAVGGCAEMIRHGENGLVLPSDFSDAQLTDSLHRMMQSGASMRAAAFRTWQKNYQADVNYTRFAQMLCAPDQERNA